MLGFRDENEGIPARLYRSPDEIRRDIAEISKKIREADEQLTVRNVLMSVISEFADAEPERWIPEFEETLAEAKEAMERLTRLEDTLEELSVELREARWARGR